MSSKYWPKTKKNKEIEDWQNVIGDYLVRSSTQAANGRC